MHTAIIKFISINITAATCWLPPLISQLFQQAFEATPFFTAGSFCADITSFCNCKLQGQPMVDLDNSF